MNRRIEGFVGVAVATVGILALAQNCGTSETAHQERSQASGEIGTARKEPSFALTTNVGGSISANTTWTLANSPYVLTSDVIVRAGATLTIEPGVVVKMNANTRQLTIQGNLIAEGTPEQHIIFTSIKDDRFGGDTGGDGPTVGAPGQWYQIRLTGPQASFKYTEMYFGGWGSSTTVYASLVANGTGTYSITDSTISNSQNAGVTINAAAMTVANNTISNNAVGVAVYNGAVQASQNSISNNSSHGMFFNITSVYAGVASNILSNTIAFNGGPGVRLQVETALAAALMPVGHLNNIVGNDNAQTKPKQLSSLYQVPTSDWTNNYWAKGTPGNLITASAVPCAIVPAGYYNVHLVYADQNGQAAPDGPVTAKMWSQSVGGVTTSCQGDFAITDPIKGNP